jgi:four helix bundle protein
VGSATIGLPALAAIRSYEDIEAFKRAMELLRPVHRLVRELPDYERYELASQIRRASKSVPANIAEGYAKRRSVRNFKAYLEHSLGSVNEMVVHLQIAEGLDYVGHDTCADLITQYRSIAMLLVRLIEKWR